MRKRTALMGLIGMAVLSGGLALMGGPAAAGAAMDPGPKAWSAFAESGVDAVPCVLAKLRDTSAFLAVLPDGQTTQALGGAVPADSEAQTLAQVVAFSRLMVRIKEDERPPQLPHLSEDQWHQLAKLSPVFPSWNAIDMRSDAAQAMIQAMRTWATLPDGPQRSAQTPKVIEAVQRAADGPMGQASKNLAAEIDQARKIITKDQLADAVKRFKMVPAMPMPPGPHGWVPYDQRPDGVYGGLVLLAENQTAQGMIRLRVAYGSAIRLDSLLPIASEGASAQFRQQVQPQPGFLGGDAMITIEMAIPFPWAGKDDAIPCMIDGDGGLLTYLPSHSSVADGGLLLQYLERTRLASKLSDFGVSVDQETKLADIRKKIDGGQKPKLTLTPAELDQLRQRVNDWWNAKPDRASAAKALQQQLHDLGQPKVAGYRAYEDLWDQMGTILTMDQKQAMVKRIFGAEASHQPQMPPATPPNEPNPGL